MSGKKNKLIRRWAKETNTSFSLAKKTWKKLSHSEKEQVTQQMDFELDLIEQERRAKVVKGLQELGEISYDTN